MDKNNDICKEFLEFGRCEQLSGKVTANEIIQVLEKSNLNIKTAVDKDMMALVKCHLKQ